MGFFDALRAEEYARGSGIRVTNACPGSVRTNVARNAVLGKKGVLRGDSDANIDAGVRRRGPDLRAHADAAPRGLRMLTPRRVPCEC